MAGATTTVVEATATGTKIADTDVATTTAHASTPIAMPATVSVVEEATAATIGHSAVLHQSKAVEVMEAVQVVLGMLHHHATMMTVVVATTRLAEKVGSLA